jgi:hypothetical protein
VNSSWSSWQKLACALIAGDPPRRDLIAGLSRLGGDDNRTLARLRTRDRFLGRRGPLLERASLTGAPGLNGEAAACYLLHSVRQLARRHDARVGSILSFDVSEQSQRQLARLHEAVSASVAELQSAIRQDARL